MTFYEFCHEKGITGNLREAFYHHLMSKCLALPEDKAELEKAWREVLYMAFRALRISEDELQFTDGRQWTKEQIDAVTGMPCV